MQVVDAERARELSLFRPLGNVSTLPQRATEIDLCYPVALPLVQGPMGGALAGISSLIVLPLRANVNRLPKKLVWLLQVQRWQCVDPL